MKTYTDLELDQFHVDTGAYLPSGLRAFLRTQGAGKYGNIEIYKPEQVDEQYRSFFDDPSELFRVYVPFGDKKVEQELLIYRPSDNTWASIWHETVPEDWPDEEWLEFTEATIPSLLGGA